MMRKNFPLINTALNIFCSLELVLAHYLFFQKTVDLLSINSLMIFLQAFYFYGILFSIGRKTIISFAAAANILIILLLVYHRVYSEPITLTTISLQYNEGLSYLRRAGSVFLSPYILGAIVYFGVIVWGVLRYYRRPQNFWLQRIIFFVPFAVILSLSYTNYHQRFFLENHFQDTVEIFGYPQGWFYEKITHLDVEKQIESVIKQANEKPLPLPSELAKLQSHRHIYVVQLESFQFFAYTKEVNGQKVMPFLNKLAEKAALYQILPKRLHPSANSDFAAMSGFYDVTNLHYVLYQIVSPEELYTRIAPITWKYKEQGYYLSFYHGFTENFYNRAPYVRAMKFDDIYFLNRLRKNYKYDESEWGVNDMNIAKLIVENQKQNPQDKSFTFFITISTHDPFDIGLTENKIFAEPKNLLERYYNGFNYVDNMLEYLVENAPEDSLFIMYSDHPIIESEPRDTFFMVYSNKQKLKSFRTIDFKQAMQIVKSILHENLSKE